MQKKSRAYYQFSKKERIGIVVFIVLGLLLLFLPYLIPPQPLPNLSNMTVDGRKWKAKLQNEPQEPMAHSARIHIYPFDPNTITETGWQVMGVPTTVAKRIGNYLKKGGRFRKAEDLRKIWGMPTSLADQLIPFIKIIDQEKTFPNYIRTVQPIDINTADIEAWKSLPGIGNVLAERIIKYRERAQGFSTKDELRSVFGLNDSLLAQLDPYLQVQESSLQKMPLNRTSAYQIALKTGIPIEVAKNIVRWRQENSAYTGMDQLLEVPGFKPEWISRFKTLFMIE